MFRESSLALRVVSLLISILVSWLLFTWIIARLPRESVSFRSAMRAALLAAVAFEIFNADGWTLRSADGSNTAHSEHTIAITETGPRILTPCTMRTRGEVT